MARARGSSRSRSSGAATRTGTCWRRPAAGGALRLRRRRLARRVPGQRHDARGLPQGLGADEPPLPQPRQRHVRGRDRAGRPRATGWGQGVCAGDYDNDGHEDLFVTLLGQNRLFRNRGRRHVRGRHREGGLARTRTRWGTGCAFLDYDRDGGLDLFVANYIDLDLATAPRPDSGPVPLQGHPGRVRAARACRAARTRSTATAATARSRTCRRRPGITRAAGTYGLGVSTLDFDDDGWTDLYVANDSNPAALYRNKRDGTFTDVGGHRGLRLQPGRQAAGGHGRRRSATTTATAPWTSSRRTSRATPRRSTRNTGEGFCEDRTFAAGIGVNTRWLGLGHRRSSTSTTTAGSTCSW